jgi:hypothetical protein
LGEFEKDNRGAWPKLNEVHESWNDFDEAAYEILGDFSAKNSVELQLGWLTKWIWGHSITLLRSADRKRKKGDLEGAELDTLKAMERQAVSREVMHEFAKLKRGGD